MTRISPQTLLDIEEAEKLFGCEIERILLIELIECVRRAYRQGVHFEELLDDIVGKGNALDEAQWHAYKRVLGKHFNRRAQKRRSLQK